MNANTDQLFFIDTGKGDDKKDIGYNIITQNEGSQSNTSSSHRISVKRDSSDNEKPQTVLGYDKEEAELEQLVFGGKPDILFDEDDNDKKSDDERSFTSTDEHTLDYQIQKGEDEKVVTKKRKPAWIDEDDETLRIDIKDRKKLRKLRLTENDAEIDGTEFSDRLKAQFEKLVGCPEWAKGEVKSENSDDEDEFFRNTRNYLGSSESLPQTFINIRRVKDANISKTSSASVKCLEFHPFSKVVLTAGMNKKLDIFQVDGETNPRIQNLFLENFPIYSAQFTPDGQQVVMSSRRKHFYVFDMATGDVRKVPNIQGRTEKSLESFAICPDGSCIAFLGDSGYINLVSLKTLQYMCSLKMNGSVKCVTFSHDGARLFSFGGDGEVYVWDMKTKKCKHKFRDDGCLKGGCIDVSKNGRFVACGSNSGVVNIYDENCFDDRNPKPIKTVMNLTTSIHCVKFNPTSEILAIASMSVKNSLRLLHIPSLTVFSNWPTSKSGLGYIQSITFSPASGFLAVGNDAGKAMLFRLRHYPDG